MTKPSGLQPPGRGRFGLKPPGSAVSAEETGHSQTNNKPTGLSGALLWSIPPICLNMLVYKQMLYVPYLFDLFTVFYLI